MKNQILEDLKNEVLSKVQPQIDVREEAKVGIARLETALSGYRAKVATIESEIASLSASAAEGIIQGADISKIEKSIRAAKMELEDSQAWVTRIETQLIPAATERVKESEADLGRESAKIIEEQRVNAEIAINGKIEEAMTYFEQFGDAAEKVQDFLKVKRRSFNPYVSNLIIKDPRFVNLVQNSMGHLFA